MIDEESRQKIESRNRQLSDKITLFFVGLFLGVFLCGLAVYLSDGSGIPVEYYP